MKINFNSIKNRINSLELAGIFFASSPLFLVTIRSWSNAILIIGFFSVLTIAFFSKKNIINNFLNTKKNTVFLIFAFSSPVISVFLSSTLRGEFSLPNFDSPSRFLLAAVIFIYALNKKINFAKYLQYSAPISLSITLCHQLFFPQPWLWGEGRMATYFSDPLVFGYTALTLGLASLLSINILEKDNILIITLKLSGAIIGFYLSIMSGSRTGWLALPIIFLLWILKNEFLKNPKIKIIATVFGFLLLFIFFKINPTINNRIAIGFKEFLEYPWIGIAPETSIGARITFLRIAFDMFMSNPLAGYGDHGYDLTKLPAKIYSYASNGNLHMALNAGFHNEIVSNTIRFGLYGFFSSAMIFLVPMYIFWKKLDAKNKIQKANALLGLIVSICFFISSFSTEVFDLKYMASFYAIVISMLCAASIAEFSSSFTKN